MQDQIFNLKFAGKQMARQSIKCEKGEKLEKVKLKKAIEKGNMEGAKIHAGNAIRQKNEALNFLALSSRIDAVASRLTSAANMSAVNRQMAGITVQLEHSLQTMNLEQISTTMDTFESQLQSLDVSTAMVADAMASSTASSTPIDEVDALMMQVADENNLELSGEMTSAPTATPQAAATATVEDDLQKRLEALKDM